MYLFGNIELVDDQRIGFGDAGASFGGLNKNSDRFILRLDN